ncbi:hypothetical protein AGLY_007235 [Aphis glycines]|uniref:Uncharacterized protein n=1 Tax=Aphis glycines TaxID=307491 RepID=A0A6G0TP01_APHGL|nr:hypothetical protein AGLY_007235 [Aphis glycines]
MQQSVIIPEAAEAIHSALTHPITYRKSVKNVMRFQFFESIIKKIYILCDVIFNELAFETAEEKHKRTRHVTFGRSKKNKRMTLIYITALSVEVTTIRNFALHFQVCFCSQNFFIDISKKILKKSKILTQLYAIQRKKDALLIKLSCSTDSKQHEKSGGISPQRAYLVETSLYIDEFLNASKQFVCYRDNRFSCTLTMKIDAVDVEGGLQSRRGLPNRVGITLKSSPIVKNNKYTKWRAKPYIIVTSIHSSLRSKSKITIKHLSMAQLI